MSVLFITHDFDVVAEIADHVAVMRYGKVVESGTKDEVLRGAKHPYTRANCWRRCRGTSRPKRTASGRRRR